MNSLSTFVASPKTAKRVCVVIPALNEAATIGSVVLSIRIYGMPVVVDDGSDDGTGELAKTAGASVVTHAARRGYDKALDSGFARADELGCDYVITMDADGQHDSGIVGMFVEALDAGADLVVGIRDRRQRVGEHIFAWVAGWKWGISDPLCGMKGYQIELYRNLGYFDSFDSIGTELAIYAAKRGKRITQLRLKTKERNSATRFGRGWDANRRIFRALLFNLWPFRRR